MRRAIDRAVVAVMPSIVERARLVLRPITFQILPEVMVPMMKWWTLLMVWTAGEVVRYPSGLHPAVHVPASF